MMFTGDFVFSHKTDMRVRRDTSKPRPKKVKKKVRKGTKK